MLTTLSGVFAIPLSFKPFSSDFAVSEGKYR